MATSLEQQLAIYLTDAHAIELQALEQVKRAPKVAGDSEIAALLRVRVGARGQVGPDSSGRRQGGCDAA